MCANNEVRWPHWMQSVLKPVLSSFCRVCKPSRRTCPRWCPLPPCRSIHHPLGTWLRRIVQCIHNLNVDKNFICTSEILNTYCTFNSMFQQHNIHLVLSTYQHKYKWILCTEKPILNTSVQDFWCTNINN